MVLKLAFRNIITKRSSIVIILFMSFAVCLFCISNAVFDSTENGVQSCFVSSFTGDLVIRPVSRGQKSLFGDETPVTGSLTKLDSLFPYKDLISTLKSNELINSFTPQLTGAAAIDDNGTRRAMFLFGVNSEDYLKMMPAVHVIQGSTFEIGTKGVMISKYIADLFNFTINDEIQFTVADGPFFRIRKAKITGIYDYDVNNAIFERYVLIDPEVLCSLMDISETASVSEESISEDKTFLLDSELDFDSLFDEMSDFYTENVIVDSEESFENENTLPLENQIVKEEVKTDLTTWNYIICNVNNGQNSNHVIHKLNRIFKKNGWPLQATDWRHAAGSTALYLFWLRLILNAGIFIVLFAGFIIVNNSLTINVLDRTREIGTLRAVGAKKRFISLQCMAETFMMTITSGFIGSLFGTISSFGINHLHINFNNSFLIQLFGSEYLTLIVTPLNIVKLFILVIVLGIIGWIYPVYTALHVNPVKAMQGAK